MLEIRSGEPDLFLFCQRSSTEQTPDFESGGWGFESHRWLLSISFDKHVRFYRSRDVAQVVEHSPDKREVGGSSPPVPTIFFRIPTIALAKILPLSVFLLFQIPHHSMFSLSAHSEVCCRKVKTLIGLSKRQGCSLSQTLQG